MLYLWPLEKGPAAFTTGPFLKSTAGLLQPHLLSPQDKQVAQPSITITALVLHLLHMVALGGKSPALSSLVALALLASNSARFSARMRLVVSLISSLSIRPTAFKIGRASC